MVVYIVVVGSERKKNDNVGGTVKLYFSRLRSEVLTFGSVMKTKTRAKVFRGRGGGEGLKTFRSRTNGQKMSRSRENYDGTIIYIQDERKNISVRSYFITTLSSVRLTENVKSKRLTRTNIFIRVSKLDRLKILLHSIARINRIR